MPDDTKEKQTDIEKNLEYIGLDLNNIPEILLDFKPIEFRPLQTYDDKEHYIYKYIPINKIQILVTPTNRLTDVKTKYSKSAPLYKYLTVKEDEEDYIEKYSIVLNMLNSISIEEIEKIETTQNELNKNIPFKVKYDQSYMWQIYYSKNTDTYFMLVAGKEPDYNYMFYLIKKQIEYSKTKNSKVPMIYVPVNHLEYSREILNKTYINDIENYLWLFTNSWATTYEVYNKEQKQEIHIVGETEVYDGLKTVYKICLKTKEEANIFYKQIKALFILQTEISSHYKFTVKIDKNGILEFYYNSVKIKFENLSDFIKKEYEKVKKDIKKQTAILKKLEKELNELKIDSLKKDKEFLLKQKQISTFLEYRKTFFGRIKYYFKSKKRNKEEVIEEPKQKQENVNDEEVNNKLIQEKENYTIEDLVIIYSVYDKIIKNIKNLELDKQALENKIKNMEIKIRNATLYINEIDEHKKSIFEFWKFANKDEVVALNEGSKQENENKKIEKVFDFETDIESLGIQLDKEQREKLNKQEHNSILVAKTIILKAINKFKNLEDISDENMQELLDILKQKFQEEKVEKQDFDIFGGMIEDKTKIKSIGNKRHRETERNVLQILDVNDDTTLVEFKDIIKKFSNTLSNCVGKILSPYNLSIYKVTESTEDFNISNLNIYDINCEKSIQDLDTDSTNLNLYKINIKENMPLIFYTNIIFYDNYNKTLPLGMNLSTNVLLDGSNYNYVLKNKEKIKTNAYSKNNSTDNELKVQTINVYEYDVFLK